MNITINGKPQLFDDTISVQSLVEALSLDMRKIAIERNLAIVPRSRYHEVFLEDGDTIEIVEFIGGG